MQVVHTAARRMGPSWLPRRRLLRALAGTASGTLGAALALTTACAERTAQRPAGEAPSELVFMDWSNIENTPTETVVNNFRAKFPQVQLAVEPTPQNYEEKMRTLIAAGTPADVHRVNDDYVRGFATKGQFVDLSPYLKRDKVKREDFYEFIYDFPIYEGKYWAWSTGNQPRLLYVNKTLFQNNGLQPPAFETWDPAGWTWDETILAAQKLTRDAHTERPTYGISLYHDTGYEQTFLVNSGIPDGIYSKDGKQFLMASPKGVAAIQSVVDLHCKLGIQRPYTFREGGSGVSAGALFRQGRLGMFYAVMSEMVGLRRDVKDFDWDVAPVPRREKRMTEGSLITYCVPQGAKHPDAAWLFLSYMTSEEGGRVFGENLFYIPARKAAATKYVKLPAGEKPEHVKLFVESMAYGTVINFTDHTERARMIYRPELEAKAYVCSESVKTTLDGVKQQVEDALAGRY